MPPATNDWHYASLPQSKERDGFSSPMQRTLYLCYNDKNRTETSPTYCTLRGKTRKTTYVSLDLCSCRNLRFTSQAQLWQLRALPVLKLPRKDIGGILSVSRCTCKIARSYFSRRAIERQIIKLFIEFFHVLVEYHESLESTDWSIESTSTKASHPGPLLTAWGQSRFSAQNCVCNQKAKRRAKHNTKG